MSDALELHEVDKIIRKRVKNGQEEYLVKWIDKRSKNTWEPAENLDFIETVPNPSNDENTEYEVEKVLKKRQKKGQVQYLLKWVGHNKSTWQPEGNLNCQELIEDFQISRAVRILAANENIYGENGLIFLMKWNEIDFPTSPVNLVEARNLWPQLLIDFFEEKMNWFLPIKTVTFIEEPVEADEVDGNPIIVHYATFVTRRLMYWVEFSEERFKFIENTKLASEFPQLVIDFLVTKAEIIRDINLDSYILLTRSMHKDLSAKNFLACTKVQIARIFALDTILIKRPAQRLVARRYTYDVNNEEDFGNGSLVPYTEPESTVAPLTVSTSNGDILPANTEAVSPVASSSIMPGLKGLKTKSILKKPKNIPIGARGRRKSTHGRIESTCADNPFWNQGVPTDSVETTAPIEPVNLTETTASVDTADLIETTEPVDSVETTAPIEPAGLIGITESVKTTAPIEPANLINQQS